MDALASHLSGYIGALGVYLLVFWKADDQLTAQGREYLYDRIWRIGATRENVISILKIYFYRGIGALQFLRNIFLFSAGSFAAFLIVYIFTTPGFAGQLAGDPTARGVVIWQLLTNGVPLVLISNYVAFSLLMTRIDKNEFNMTDILIDVGIRIAIFITMTAAYYSVSALYFGSFAGDVGMALQAVMPTMSLAANFRNLTGVYFYATVLSSLPLFLAVCVEAAGREGYVSRIVRNVVFFFPFEGKPLRSMAAVVGVFVLVFFVAIKTVTGIVMGIARAWPG